MAAHGEPAQPAVTATVTTTNGGHRSALNFPGAFLCKRSRRAAGEVTFLNLNARRLPPQRRVQICQARLYVPDVLCFDYCSGAAGGHAPGTRAAESRSSDASPRMCRPLTQEVACICVQLELVNMHRTGELTRLVGVAKQTDLTFNLVSSSQHICAHQRAVGRLCRRVGGSGVWATTGPFD